MSLSLATIQHQVAELSEIFDDDESVYSDHESEILLQHDRSSEEEVNGFLELEATIATSVYQCVQLIKQRHTSTESHSLEEIQGFKRLYTTKADLLDLYHVSEELIHHAAFRSSALSSSAKALHAEENALLREFHSLHCLVWEGHFMEDGELSELEDLLEQNLPWLTTLQQQGRQVEAQIGRDDSKVYRQPEDYLQTTLKILKLRVYLASKSEDLRLRGTNAQQVESAQRSPGNNESILEELQRAYDFLVEKDTSLKPKLEPSEMEYATGEGCKDEFCRRQQYSLAEQTRRLHPVYETAAKNAEEIHKLREALLAMRKDRDSVIARKSISSYTPLEKAQKRTSRQEGDVAQALGDFYISSLPSREETSLLSESITARRENAREKETLDRSKKEQVQRLAEIEGGLTNIEAQKLILETREHKVTAEEERLRGMAIVKAVDSLNVKKQRPKSPMKMPQIQGLRKPSSKIDMLMQRYEAQSQPEDQKLVDLAELRRRKRSSIPRPISNVFSAKSPSPPPRPAPIVPLRPMQWAPQSPPYPTENGHINMPGSSTHTAGSVRVSNPHPSGQTESQRPRVPPINTRNSVYEVRESARAAQRVSGSAPPYPAQDGPINMPAGMSIAAPRVPPPSPLEGRSARGQELTPPALSTPDSANGSPRVRRHNSRVVPARSLYPPRSGYVTLSGSPSSVLSGVQSNLSGNDSAEASRLHQSVQGTPTITEDMHEEVQTPSSTAGSRASNGPRNKRRSGTAGRSPAAFNLPYPLYSDDRTTDSNSEVNSRADTRLGSSTDAFYQTQGGELSDSGDGNEYHDFMREVSTVSRVPGRKDSSSQ